MQHFFLRRAVVLGAVAMLSLLVVGPAQAQLRGAVATPAAPSSATPAAPHLAACTVGTDQVRFDFALPRTARLLVSGLPIKIVALGSSSTYGVGASTPAASYPSRLADELDERFHETNHIGSQPRGHCGPAPCSDISQVDLGQHMIRIMEAPD